MTPSSSQVYSHSLAVMNRRWTAYVNYRLLIGSSHTKSPPPESRRCARTFVHSLSPPPTQLQCCQSCQACQMSDSRSFRGCFRARPPTPQLYRVRQRAACRQCGEGVRRGRVRVRTLVTKAPFARLAGLPPSTTADSVPPAPELIST